MCSRPCRFFTCPGLAAEGWPDPATPKSNFLTFLQARFPLGKDLQKNFATIATTERITPREKK